MLTGTDILTIERTIQLAIAPAFVLAGIMAVLNLLTGRLQRLADREREIRGGDPALPDERRLLVRRTRILYGAIGTGILAAVLICVLVIVSFVEPFFGVTAGLHVAGLLVAGMVALTATLLLFLSEVLLSRRSLPFRDDP